MKMKTNTGYLTSVLHCERNLVHTDRQTLGQTDMTTNTQLK